MIDNPDHDNDSEQSQYYHDITKNKYYTPIRQLKLGKHSNSDSVDVHSSIVEDTMKIIFKFQKKYKATVCIDNFNGRAFVSKH